MSRRNKIAHGILALDRNQMKTLFRDLEQGKVSPADLTTYGPNMSDQVIPTADSFGLEARPQDKNGRSFDIYAGDRKLGVLGYNMMEEAWVVDSGEMVPDLEEAIAMIHREE